MISCVTSVRPWRCVISEDLMLPSRLKLNKATGLYKNSAHLLKDSARRRYHLYIAIKGTFALYLEKFDSCTLHSKLYPYIRKVINRNLGSVSILPTFCNNIIERAFNTQIYGKNEKTLKRFSFKHELQYPV